MEKARDYKLDWMRAIAIILVLLIHSSTRYLDSGTAGMQIALIISTLSRPCIAIFLFLAGYLYEPKTNQTGYFFNKFKRVLFPYLAVSFFAIWYTYKGVPIDSIWQNKLVILRDIVFGNTTGIYYFVFLILVIYLLYYIYLRIFKTKYIEWVLMFFLIVNILHGFLSDSISNALSIDLQTYVFYLYRSPLVWIVFFLFGVVVRKKREAVEEQIGKNKRITWLIFVSMVLFVSVLILNGESINMYNTLIGTLFSLATIAFLYIIRFRRSKIIEAISKSSYLIYLTHIFVVYLFYDITQNLPRSLLLAFISFVLSFIIPFVLVNLASKYLPENIKKFL